MRNEQKELHWSRRSFLKLGGVTATAIVSTSLTSTGIPFDSSSKVDLQQEERINEALRIASASDLVKDEFSRLGTDTNAALTTNSIKLSSLQESDVGLILEPGLLQKADRGNSISFTVDLAMGAVRCLQIIHGSTGDYSVEVASIIYDASRPAVEMFVGLRDGNGTTLMLQPRQEQQWSIDHVAMTAQMTVPNVDVTKPSYKWLGAAKGAWFTRDKLRVFLLASVSESASLTGKEPITHDFVLNYESDALYHNFPELDVFLPKSTTTTPR